MQTVLGMGILPEFLQGMIKTFIPLTNVTTWLEKQKSYLLYDRKWIKENKSSYGTMANNEKQEKRLEKREKRPCDLEGKNYLSIRLSQK